MMNLVIQLNFCQGRVYGMTSNFITFMKADKIRKSTKIVIFHIAIRSRSCLKVLYVDMSDSGLSLIHI